MSPLSLLVLVGCVVTPPELPAFDTDCPEDTGPTEPTTPPDTEPPFEGVPDLWPFVTATPEGDDLDVAITVYNSGTEASAAPPVVEVTIDHNPSVRLEANAPLMPGNNVILHQDMPAGPGKHQITVVVDPDGVEAEEDRDNNEVTIEQTIDFVDLMIRDVTFEAENNITTYTIIVQNIGTLPAGPVWVDAYVDEPSRPSGVRNGQAFTQLNWLEADQVQAVTLAASGDCVAGCESWVLIDGPNSIAEAEESNNAFGPISVVHEPSTIDLQIDSVVTSYDSWSGTASYDVTVRNNGAAPASSFWIDAFVDRATAPVMGELGEGYIEVSGLDGGATTSVTLYASASCSEICNSWVIVDTDDLVFESDEGNNIEGPFLVF